MSIPKTLKSSSKASQQPHHHHQRRVVLPKASLIQVYLKDSSVATSAVPGAAALNVGGSGCGGGGGGGGSAAKCRVLPKFSNQEILNHLSSMQSTAATTSTDTTTAAAAKITTTSTTASASIINSSSGSRVVVSNRAIDCRKMPPPASQPHQSQSFSAAWSPQASRKSAIKESKLKELTRLCLTGQSSASQMSAFHQYHHHTHQASSSSSSSSLSLSSLTSPSPVVVSHQQTHRHHNHHQHQQQPQPNSQQQQQQQLQRLTQERPLSGDVGTCEQSKSSSQLDAAMDSASTLLPVVDSASSGNIPLQLLFESVDQPHVQQQQHSKHSLARYLAKDFFLDCKQRLESNNFRRLLLILNDYNVSQQQQHHHHHHLQQQQQQNQSHWQQPHERALDSVHALIRHERTLCDKFAAFLTAESALRYDLLMQTLQYEKCHAFLCKLELFVTNRLTLKRLAQSIVSNCARATETDTAARKLDDIVARVRASTKHNALIHHELDYLFDQRRVNLEPCFERVSLLAVPRPGPQPDTADKQSRIEDHGDDNGEDSSTRNTGSSGGDAGANNNSDNDDPCWHWEHVDLRHKHPPADFGSKKCSCECHFNSSSHSAAASSAGGGGGGGGTAGSTIAMAQLSSHTPVPPPPTAFALSAPASAVSASSGALLSSLSAKLDEHNHQHHNSVSLLSSGGSSAGSTTAASAAAAVNAHCLLCSLKLVKGQLCIKCEGKKAVPVSYKLT